MVSLVPAKGVAEPALLCSVLEDLYKNVVRKVLFCSEAKRRQKQNREGKGEGQKKGERSQRMCVAD
jgi:hypothetical protein